MLGMGGASAAPFVSLEYESNEKRANHQTSMSAATIIGYKAEDQNEYTFKAGFSQPSLGHGEISEGFEAQVKMPFAGSDRYIPYVTLGLGEKIAATDRLAYYFFDAGIKLPLVSGVAADVGSHSVNAFDPDRRYYTTRFHAALSYAVTKFDSVGVRLARSYGVTAQEKDSWRLLYTHAY